MKRANFPSHQISLSMRDKYEAWLYYFAQITDYFCFHMTAMLMEAANID